MHMHRVRRVHTLECSKCRSNTISRNSRLVSVVCSKALVTLLIATFPRGVSSGNPLAPLEAVSRADLTTKRTYESVGNYRQSATRVLLYDTERIFIFPFNHIGN